MLLARATCVCVCVCVRVPGLMELQSYTRVYTCAHTHTHTHSHTLCLCDAQVAHIVPVPDAPIPRSSASIKEWAPPVAQRLTHTHTHTMLACTRTYSQVVCECLACCSCGRYCGRCRRRSPSPRHCHHRVTCSVDKTCETTRCTWRGLESGGPHLCLYARTHAHTRLCLCSLLEP